MNRIVFGLTVASAVSLSLPAAAAVVVDYDISGATTGASTAGPIAVNSAAANVTASAMTSAGISDVASSGNKANSIGGNSWNSGSFDADDEYIAFSVTPDAGYTLDLNTLYFNEAANNSVGANAEWQIRSSLDGYNSIVASESISNGFQDISSAGYQAIALGAAFDDVQSMVEFRIYGTGFADFSGQWFVADPSETFSNFTLEGEVVPEPATLALGLISGAVMLARRSRRA